MTPDFVLSLFFEGIRLHRRTAEGWALVGEVPLDSPDLARDLHALRDAGIATGTPWTGTRLLLPPEQVRVLDLEGERDLAGVRAALEGVTPYAVDDLVVDWEVRDGRTHVAAVARETLDEAEAFAAEHGFLPVGFAAPLAGFPREADFGSTRLAATLPAATAPLAESASEAEPSAVVAEEPTLAAPPSAPPEPTATEAPAEPSRTGPEPLPDPLPAPAGETSLPEASEPEVTDHTAASVESAHGPAPAAPPSAEPAPIVADPPLEQLPADPVAASTPVPEPIFASRARPLRAERSRPFDGPPAARKADSTRVEPSVRKPAPPPGEGWALNSATAAARPDPRMPPRAPAVAIRPGKPAGPLASATEALRSAPVAAVAAPGPDQSAALPPVAPDVAATSPSALAASRPAGASRLAPQAFPREDAPARPRGKPRFLGLILTVLLLIVMAAVALWASTSEQGLAGLFRGAETPATVAVVPPPEAPSVAPVTPAPQAAATTPRSPGAAPEVLAGPAPATPPAPDAEVAASAAAAVASAMADLSRAAEPPPTPGTPAGPADPLATAAAPALGGVDTAVPPAEADRFYAATGVWLRAPSLSLLPDTDAAALQAPAVPSPSVTQDPAEPPVLAAVAPDSRPAPPSEPPTPTEATAPEAGPALAPEAAAPEAQVAAGPPAPPTAPDDRARIGALAEPPDVAPTERPEPSALTAVQGPPVAADALTTDAWVNAMAEPPDVLPPARPDTPPEFLEALAAEAATAPVQPGALAFAATSDGATPGGVDLAGLRPALRPEGLAPPGDEPPTAVLASFDGPRPGPRPEGLAPEPEPESPDVSQALAEALAAPEAPAAPDLQSTLAAIVQGAPDPLAGATPRAVAVARVPDARPRNFERVVQRQLDRVARASQAPAAGSVGTGGLTAQEQAEAAGEAEEASSAAAAPSGVTPTSVAQAATVADAIRMREINLIGVYGQPNARRALIRLANGRYVRVGVGDQFDGGQVTAIGDNALNYTRRGRTFQLVIPGG